MTSFANAYAAFATGLRLADLPPKAMETVRTGFIDCVAAMMAGAREPVVEAVRHCIGASANAGESRLVLGTESARADDAAFVNGTAAHALDYDDVALGAHPSAILVPAILCEAEAVGADGATMVRAYAAGYEIWADLWQRDRDSHHQKGWHPTSIFGTVAAAAAAAVLRGLDAQRTAHALGIAASQASGLVANFGTMTKPFHVGRACQSGILAARLAAAGMTAADDVFESPQGYLAAFSPSGRVDAATQPALGKEWRLVRNGLNVKLYPMCYATHRAIDAMRAHCARRKLAPDDIADILVTFGPTQQKILRYPRPSTPLEAKFSIEFALAAAIISGDCRAEVLTDEFVARPDVRALESKVRTRVLAELDPDDSAFAIHDTVDVTLRSGEVLAGAKIRYAHGHARNPASQDELWRKFAECVAASYTPTTARALFDKLASIEALRGVSELPLADRVN